jgi:hypothetical protein
MTNIDDMAEEFFRNDFSPNKKIVGKWLQQMPPDQMVGDLPNPRRIKPVNSGQEIVHTTRHLAQCHLAWSG